MKTKTLIEALQKIDPSGELECCVGNSDIHFVDITPAYWDGCLQVLKRDPSKPGYSVVGAEYRSNGEKVVIVSLSIADALLNNTEMPVTYETDYARRHYEEFVENERKENREIEARIKERK